MNSREEDSLLETKHMGDGNFLLKSSHLRGILVGSTLYMRNNTSRHSCDPNPAPLKLDGQTDIQAPVFLLLWSQCDLEDGSFS